jgi:glycosyltransferase involved in cell wall biosynthesis
MKVLLTTHQFFPDFQSGTEVLTLSIARELMARGHKVLVLTGYPTGKNFADDERFDEYEFEGIHVHRFHHAYVPMGGQSSKIEVGFDNRLAAEYFVKMLTFYRPNIVHFFHLNRLGTGLILKAVDAGVPAFFTPTDFWAICPTAQLVYCDGQLCAGPSQRAGNCLIHFLTNTLGQTAGKLTKRLPISLGDFLVWLVRDGLLSTFPYVHEVVAMSRRLTLNVNRLNQLRRIVVPNRMMEELMLKYGVEPARLVRSAYGIDINEGKRFPRSVPRVPLRVGFIGTLAPHKGCHLLIEAFRLLPAGDATLNIYGRESDFPNYAMQLRELADGNRAIGFFGVFPNSQIGLVLDDLDVLVVPSIWNENTPLVIYSAQAAGCPVVASNVSGISEVITNNVNGLLLEPGSVEALSGCLLQLVRTPELLTRLSALSSCPKSTSEYVDELLAIWQEN